jgi:hypothetical protein
LTGEAGLLAMQTRKRLLVFILVIVVYKLCTIKREGYVCISCWLDLSANDYGHVTIAMCFLKIIT